MYVLFAGQYPMDVQEIRLGNALFNTRLEKSMFFVGEPIQICMKGKFRQGLSSLSAGATLQNSVHGDVQVIGDLVKIKYPFCDIDTNACNGFRGPSCGQRSVQQNQDFCFCSVLKEVPTSPDVSGHSGQNAQF